MRKNLHGRVDAAPKNRMARARSNTAVQLSSLRCPREGIAHRFLGNFAVALDVGSWPMSAGELSGPLMCKSQAVCRHNDRVTSHSEADRLVGDFIQKRAVRVFDSLASQLCIAPKGWAGKVEACDERDAERFRRSTCRANSEDEPTVRFRIPVESCIRTITRLKKLVRSGNELGPRHFRKSRHSLGAWADNE